MYSVYIRILGFLADFLLVLCGGEDMERKSRIGTRTIFHKRLRELETVVDSEK